MPTVQAALAAHFQAIRDTHLRELFSQDSVRFDRFSLRVGGILLD